MTRGLSLILNVASGKAPPRLLFYAIRNKIDRLFKTGNRRFEFERRYLEFQDPWNYHSSPYEREKYQRTLETALKWRRRNTAALEVGCSLGVFTKLLSGKFERITAIDLSKEAIRAAEEFNKLEKKTRFVVGDLRSLKSGEKYDVIFCAEVLAYIPETDAPIVCRQLDDRLRSDGIILLVTLHEKPKQDFYYFDAWEEAFAPYFEIISKEVVADSTRPYEIVVFSRRAAKGD